MYYDTSRCRCPMGTFPYTILPGDTLYSIALRYHTTINEILMRNPRINPYCLRIGQIICVPMPPIPKPCPAGTFPYTIQAGDTFYSLAKRYHVSLEELLAANPGVDPNNLQIGQKICIPQVNASGCPADTFSYTIRPGDTFYLLAQRFHTTVEAIQAANPNKDPHNLIIGEQLYIPITDC
ncbi:LysM peptidoglycan-binding domain-containing protein [Garciella nitratireducens]|uniref:LysM domain-containing protein n=1 Tax=Garciella nitratireducens DSM 15102 TaxID=1121911 RepID=A0A1T4NDA0_9FIRM|nr:LysM peptidoglycan-binding domain-containing protein [Garciella nitratireducens]RBP44092.1 LysM domain-containing protein [Garciella nitratireducens]SJZ77242.1 LysM domain-containing protein [Garciella nitratireducens DSM 15102]